MPWLAAVFIGVPLLFWFGSVRLRICLLLMVLVVSLGDPLVVGTVKDSVARPRPFVVLKDDRVYVPQLRRFDNTGIGYVAPLPDGSLPPNANRHSLPSAHAANWFALATVGFLFYRRSARWLFPMAAAVAFSRVYNGVHYPGDVTVGAILGTGYAIAFVVLMQMLWNWIGKTVFPAWHAQLPNLLNPESKFKKTEPVLSKSETGNRKSEMDWLRLGYLVIVLALVARWIYIASGIVGLSEDETYQWIWSKHLALSYYSKPPGIAFIQWFGTLLCGDTELGVVDVIIGDKLVIHGVITVIIGVLVRYYRSPYFNFVIHGVSLRYYRSSLYRQNSLEITRLLWEIMKGRFLSLLLVVLYTVRLV